MIKNFDNWSPCEGFPEGSGRSEKIWLKSPNGEFGLFKYPKRDSRTDQTTSEHVSEHLAYRIGETIGVKTARVEIGTYQNRIGSMSYRINQENEALIEGAQFILGMHPGYDINNLYDRDTGEHYCIDFVLNAVPVEEAINHAIQMMMFDFLIGNSDRHQSNWAYVFKQVTEPELMVSLTNCPLYDNGSSLCSYINEEQVTGYLGKDMQRFNSLVETRSKSLIRINCRDDKRPTHTEVLEHLLGKYSVASIYAGQFIERLTSEIIEELVDVYDDNLLSANKKKLIKKFLNKKIEILADKRMDVR